MHTTKYLCAFTPNVQPKVICIECLDFVQAGLFRHPDQAHGDGVGCRLAAILAKVIGIGIFADAAVHAPSVI